MRLERCGGFFLWVLIIVWILGNTAHYMITVKEPNKELIKQAERENRSFEPQHNNSGMYADVLSKIKSCDLNVDEATRDKFYSCPTGEKITQINWTREQGKRKGVVTRYYDAKGDLRLIYGHPDDK